MKPMMMSRQPSVTTNRRNIRSVEFCEDVVLISAHSAKRSSPVEIIGDARDELLVSRVFLPPISRHNAAIGESVYVSRIHDPIPNSPIKIPIRYQINVMVVYPFVT
jgi:hypothetical protein